MKLKLMFCNRRQQSHGDIYCIFIICLIINFRGVIMQGEGILAMFAMFFIIGAAISLIPLIGMWKMFVKAGKPGWAVLVPIYNTFVILDIAGKPSHWFWLMFIPFYNLFLLWQVFESLALAYGKDKGFAVGLFLIAPLFIMILGFDKSVYSKQALLA